MASLDREILTVKKGFGTLLIAHIMFCIPYVMLSVTPKLRSLDPNLIDAAMDLGATPFQALAKVIVPQIKPGIVSGALIAFTMSFDDFVISYFTTGNGVNNISILVYTMSKRVNPSINALSTIVILLITLVLGVVNIVPIVREKREKDGKSSRAVSRKAMAAVGAGRCRRHRGREPFPAAQERRGCREVRQQRFEALPPRRVPRRERHLRL